MTTHEQVLIDLRKLITTAECGDCETPTNTRLTCQRAVELIEALTKPASIPPVVATLAVGSLLKARDVPVGGLALDLATPKGGSALIFHDHDDRGTWLVDEFEVGHDWWPWGEHVCGASDCIFLGYPAFTTRTCVRECMDAAADASPDCRRALERVGLLK